jgi:hypothetical protein
MLLNRIKSDSDDNLKTKLKGANCKTGSKAMKSDSKNDVANILNDIRQMSHGTLLAGELLEKDKSKVGLCEELELLLRHRDKIDGSKTIRYFYRMEEYKFLKIKEKKE